MAGPSTWRGGDRPEAIARRGDFSFARESRVSATMRPRMGSTIPPELTRPDVRTAIVEAMAATYEISQERHDPTVGDDNMIFGQHVWKTGSHFLKKGLTGLPDCRADYVNQSLDIQ